MTLAAGTRLGLYEILAPLGAGGMSEVYRARTNFDGNSVSLWRAADLTLLGAFSTGANTEPDGVCSDGLNFWITLFGTQQLARF